MEKYKKYLVGLIILVVGIVIGKFFSGTSEEHASHANEMAKEQVWTCSMHPQIRSNEPGLCPICGMDLIPLDESTGASLSDEAIVLGEDALQLANIQTSAVTSSNAKREIQLLGTVKPDEGRLFSQVSHLSGRIERLYVNTTGQYVNRGQRVARLYAPDFVTAQKELFEAKKSKDVYPQLYEATRNKMKLWKLTDTQIDAIEASGVVQEQLDIHADHSGYVMKRNVELGDYVKEGSNMFDIANLDRVWVMFDAYAADLLWIKKGDPVEFKVEAIPGREFKGEVSYVDPFISSDSRVAKVRVEYQNKSGDLLPEMFATGLFSSRLELDANSLVIPKSAVLWTGKKGIVYVKDPGTDRHAFYYREVELGADLGEFYVVHEGLEEGEEVATNGVFRIDASAQLSGKKSMMNASKEDKTGSENPFLVEESLDREGQNPSFQNELGQVLDHYMDIKDRLVADDPKGAAQSAKSAIEALNKVETSLLEGEARDLWTQNLEQLEKSLRQMSGDSDLPSMRNAFEPLTASLFRSIQNLGWSSAKADTVYVAFCPMVDDNKGGYWLSFRSHIENPYFGAQMLQCGEVVKSITE